METEASELQLTRHFVIKMLCFITIKVVGGYFKWDSVVLFNDYQSLRMRRKTACIQYVLWPADTDL